MPKNCTDFYRLNLVFGNKNDSDLAKFIFFYCTEQPTAIFVLEKSSSCQIINWRKMEKEQSRKGA